MKKFYFLICIAVLEAALMVGECRDPPVEGSENIVILRVEYFAINLNDEYIVIYNSGDTSVDISDWVVFNSYYDQYRQLPMNGQTDKLAWRHVYKIPRGIILEPKDWVRICSGFGKDNEMYLYRNLMTQWLENSGEIIYLMDDRGNLIHQFP
ncbi:MAG: lamin tail domain-containing protein [Theionarchaea archaeon]|nr:lamin tail domain-containing protein [Theionarchaea archaeon]